MIMDWARTTKLCLVIINNLLALNKKNKENKIDKLTKEEARIILNMIDDYGNTNFGVMDMEDEREYLKVRNILQSITIDQKIKWRSCSTCKSYNVCGGSSSNPKWHPCKGWEKKERRKK